ncbi:MAG: adenosylmethionine--8-amino-7-oxononanoate transaminase [Deltaproteobacteria bacterium]|nr:adenosylmethionine--8-amino-7-oxononanoate transaminase [Deltaproteobacteria bacterium]
MKKTPNQPDSPIWLPYTQMKTALPQLKVKSAKGVYLHLEDGRKIMDCISSWWVILHGHAQKEIAQAISNQAKNLEQVISAGYTHQPAEDLAQKLIDALPRPLSRVFFSDNGSTAVEVALKIAFQYWKNLGVTNRTRFLCFEGDYHGDTIGAMSAADKSAFNDVFSELLFPCDQVPFPFTFKEDETADQKEEKALERLDEMLKINGSNYAAMIIEPLVQGACGFRICRTEFLSRLKEKLQAYGILLIFDEVMTGFGRTGEIFACIKANCVPDIICLSKGITGGFLPLGVSVCTEEIYQAFYADDPKKTFYHGHSYTANPICCAASLASFELLQKTQAKLKKIENWHRDNLDELSKSGLVEKTRFMGTIAAMDVKLGPNKEYSPKDTRSIIKAFQDKGFLIRPLGNTIYILPPYCIVENELTSVYQTIGDVLGSLRFHR